MNNIRFANRIWETRLLASCLALIISFCASNCAASEEANLVLARWSQGLDSASRICARYRIERINHTFQNKTILYGEFLRESNRRWRVSISEQDTTAVSALCPANDCQGKSCRFLILQNADDFVFGCPDAEFLEFWSSAEFEKLLNAPLSWNPLAWVGQKFSQGIFRTYTAELLFPVLLVSHVDIQGCDLKLHRNNEGRTYLLLTPQQDSSLSDHFKQIEVVFEADESLPVAVRTIDSPGTYEVRIYVTSFDVNSAANIAPDAFDLPENTQLLSPSEHAKRFQRLIQ